MITIINGLPDNVLGIHAEGKITAEDYETVLMPALHAKIKEHHKIRILYQIAENFDGFALGAMLDDAKVGIEHITAWEKVAFVSENHWINSMTGFFRHLIPVELRVFNLSQMDEAREWLLESTHHQTWLERALERLNTEFPLSGAETEEDFSIGDDESSEDTTEREHLNSNFPLSGGTAD